MKAEPKLALRVLKLFASGHDALAGDLLERCRSGKSGFWLWRQVVAGVVTSTRMEWQSDGVGALKAVALGWGAMLVFFFVAGDLLAHSADQTLPRLLSLLGAHHAAELWLDRFRYIPPAVIGVVLSGWIAGRPVLFYAASVLVALIAAITALAWYAVPVAVPHTLFYVVILALPYWWWSGLLIVPALIVLGGLWRAASAHPLDETRA
jgi:hypothetical protein